MVGKGGGQTPTFKLHSTSSLTSSSKSSTNNVQSTTFILQQNLDRNESPEQTNDIIGPNYYSCQHVTHEH